MVKTPMVKRTLYVPLNLWEAAKAKADAEGKSAADIVREAIERYVKS